MAKQFEDLEIWQQSRELCKNIYKITNYELFNKDTVRQLEGTKRFYRTFPIASAVRTQFNWLQYKLLIQIDDVGTSAPLSPRCVSGSERSRTAGLLRCSCLTARNDAKRKIIIQNHINQINQSSDK